MPRKPRIFQPNVPCHVISRGNNRNICFYNNADYVFYLKCLNDACLKYSALVHTYVLMTNHVHLLITPQYTNSIPKVMQSIGRRYVQYINKRQNRTGTLWEGRYKANSIDDEAYLLACSRYIELNPVRAAMVKHPCEYQWSSYLVNSGCKPRKNLTEHELYTRLGDNAESRAKAYCELFNLTELGS